MMRLQRNIPATGRRLLQSRAGFSLIEVLVAVSIFAFGMLGLAAGAISITRANKTAQFHTMATNLAQEKLEQLKSTSVAFVSSCTSSCEADPPTYLGVTFTRSWSAALNVPQPGLKQITVTVKWTDYMLHEVNVISAMSTS
ncbi:MAG TPA: prepilin-type N-terminal cleavage/methylation domain-containing protein [Verrucomicrobiae bacterium]|jgi:prepilin-type N-terminal cleavage/methylation domain-containing protein|nr:prepilin-type N-terminal cleavage/methylation domain-containing protein [Verrucomicrobiae bacterium]